MITALLLVNENKRIHLCSFFNIMNLDEISLQIKKCVKFEYWKPIGRKSSQQPHVWFLQEGNEIKYVLKIAAPITASKLLLKHEIELYSKIYSGLSHKSAISLLPELVTTGFYNDLPFLVLTYSNFTPAEKWIGHFMKFKMYSLVNKWQKIILEKLVILQADSSIRSLLGIKKEEYLTHNDFNYFNILGINRNVTIIDWESWSTADVNYYDAYHLLVTPTLIGTTAYCCGENFVHHWVKRSTYCEMSVLLLKEIIGVVDWEHKMEKYLIQQCSLPNSTEILNKFETCLTLWRSR